MLHSNDKCLQTDIAIIDLSKAFDSVPHEELLCKLETYGIKGSIHKWLRTLLTERHMQVVVEDETSNKMTIDSGVPQETVLGPILFLCHINDIPCSVTYKYDYSPTIVFFIQSEHKRADHISLQNALSELEKWAEIWDMRFNAKNVLHNEHQ